MSNNTQAQEAKYFDLHTTGIGYLNRIREVPIRRGEPFLAVTVAALHGAADSVEYSYIDCKVVGAQAEKLVRRCKEAVEAKKKVLISFRIGDIWADPFIHQKGEKQGRPDASLKGRLLFISWIKVDGTTVYDAKEEAEKPSKAKANRKVNQQPLLNKPLLEHGLIEYRPSSRGPFTTYAMRHSSSHTHPGHHLPRAWCSPLSGDHHEQYPNRRSARPAGSRGSLPL